ncbi:GntR family transcriptional regulator [Thioclava pacifica]|uniref:HTH gntR-type domain-containing protein n=1 Tax=Thioclava pacifica DSM 10166 TaxID=1353537 RepID=A0A074J7U9_9RHOB|nr:GntR family transcriptional regulator [Thioclava pacifica]KEO52609.1 hypothetical protein TP2_06635 [Thioclava pacifica DSM 10166]
MAALQKIAKESGGNRTDEVLGRIRADILSLTLAPGEPVTERFLESHYDVSRTPIRQALATLANEGLVERDSRSWIVAPFNMPLLREVFEFREEIEAVVVRLVCERASAEELNALQATVDRGLEPMTPESWLGAGLDIHVELAALTRNRFLTEAVRDCVARAARARWLLASNAEDRKVAHHEHSEIIALIRKGDAAKAEAALRAHTRAVRDQIIRAIEDARRILGARSFVDTPP